MQVSFIIPLYNCLALTQAGLASLQATLPSGLAHEIVFVDDGSTDGTRAWLATLRAPIRVVLNDRNLGYAGANNRGVAVATGDLVVLLNNDLVFTRGWLEPLLRAHRALGPRAGFVGNVQFNATTGAVDHSGVFINLKGKPEHLTALPPRWLRALASTRRVAAVTGACALISRARWIELGGFDEAFKNGGEDVDLCLRARAAGLVNIVVLTSIIRHHISASPGRKVRDEHNSRRLATRWRAELARLAARRWCWNFLDREWTGTREPADHVLARSALFYALYLRRTPPPVALAGMDANLRHEFDRWEKLLGPATP